MKNLIFTIAITLVTLFSFSQEGITITVSTNNVINDNGSVGYALHSQDTFMKAAPITSIDSKIVDGKVTVTFKNIVAGNYAILALHDANGNGTMDFAQNGMPLENYGASNNVLDFGPPQFSDAKFVVADKDLELKIRF